MTTELTKIRPAAQYCKCKLFNDWFIISPECVALYSYNGEAGDLSFQEGDVISITKSEGDWWEGTVNGQKGIFPANYVKMKETEVKIRSQTIFITVLETCVN